MPRPSPRDRASVFFLKSVALTIGTFSATDFLQNQKGLHPCEMTMSILDVVSVWTWER